MKRVNLKQQTWSVVISEWALLVWGWTGYEMAHTVVRYPGWFCLLPWHRFPTLFNVNSHTHSHTQDMHAHRLFSARLREQQTLADSGGSDGSTSSELNQLAYLQRGHAAFAGLPGSEGITASPRPTNSRPHTLQHLLGFGPSLRGKNWICSERGLIQWRRLGSSSSVLHQKHKPTHFFVCVLVVTLCCCIVIAVPGCIKSLISKPDVVSSYISNRLQSKLG